MKKIIINFLILASVCSCASTDNKQSRMDKMGEVESRKAQMLMGIIKNINLNSPESIKSSFTVYGDSKGKKFKFEGRLNFSKNKMANISLLDYIFKSPVLKFYRSGEKLYFYYPTDKKLYVDDYNKIRLSNYTGFNADFGFVYSLFTGNIPILKGSWIKKCVKSPGHDSYFLVLENDDFYESIYFKKDKPNKILIIHKSTRQKFEIYINSLISKGKSSFIRKSRMVAPGMNLRMNVSFYRIKLNAKTVVSKFKPGSVRKGVKVIKIN